MVPKLQLNPSMQSSFPRLCPTYQTASTTGFRIDASTDGAAYMIIPNQSAKLVDVYVFITAAAGTPPTLTCELNAYTSPGVIGAAITGYSATATGRSNAGWVKFTFTNGSRAALVASTTYFLKITSTGDASNYNDVGMGYNMQGSSDYNNWSAYNTTNSFGTNNLANRQSIGLVVTFDNGAIQGNPYTKGMTDTSNTYKRGLYIPAMDAPLIISGALFSSLTGYSNFEIWQVGAGSADAVISMAPGMGPGGGQFLLPTLQTLPAGVDMRVVVAYSSASTRPGTIQIEDPDTYADLLAVRMGGGWHKTEHNGTSWTEYPEQYPCMALLIAAGAAGGGSSLQTGAVY